MQFGTLFVKKNRRGQFVSPPGFGVKARNFQTLLGFVVTVLCPASTWLRKI
jgi:hypothetical protein